MGTNYLDMFEMLYNQGQIPTPARDDLDTWYTNDIPTPRENAWNLEEAPMSSQNNIPMAQTGDYEAMLNQTMENPPIMTQKENEVYDTVMQNIPNTQQGAQPQHNYLEQFEDLSKRKERTITDTFIRNVSKAIGFMGHGPIGGMAVYPMIEEGIYKLFDREIPVEPDAEFQFEYANAIRKGYKEVGRSLARGLELATRDYLKAPKPEDYDMEDPYERWEYTKKLALSMLDDPLVPATVAKQPMNRAFGRLALLEDLQPDEDYMKRAANKKGMIKHLETFTASAPQMASQVAAHILTGGIGGGVFMALQIAGSEYDQIMQDNPGIDPDRAALAAWGSAAVQAPMEALSMALGIMSPVIKKFIINKALRFGINKLFGASLEGLTERLQEIPSVFFANWAKDPEYIDKILNGEVDVVKDILGKGWEQGKEPGWIGFAWGLLLGGGHGKPDVKTNKDLNQISDTDYDLLAKGETDITQLQKKYKGKLDVQSIIDKAHERYEAEVPVEPAGAIPTQEELLGPTDREAAEYFGINYNDLFDNVALTPVDEVTGEPQEEIEEAPPLKQEHPKWKGPAQYALEGYGQRPHYANVKLTQIPVKNWSMALSGSFYKGIINEDIAPGEKIKKAALRYKDEIFEGRTHADAYDKLREKFGEVPDDAWADGSIEDGFTTSKDRFIDRDEAFEVAERAKQIYKGARVDRGYLVSEALEDIVNMAEFKEKKKESARTKLRNYLKLNISEYQERYKGYIQEGFYPDRAMKLAVADMQEQMEGKGISTDILEDASPGDIIKVAGTDIKIDALGEEGTTTPPGMVQITVQSGPAMGATFSVKTENLAKNIEQRINEFAAKRTIPISDEMKRKALKEADIKADISDTKTITINPERYIDLTTGSEQVKQRIIDTAPSQYNAKRFEGSNAPLLVVQQDGQIIGHDGRHRAATFMKSGMDNFPVLLIPATTDVDVNTIGTLKSQKFGKKARMIEHAMEDQEKKQVLPSGKQLPRKIAQSLTKERGRGPKLVAPSNTLQKALQGFADELGMGDRLHFFEPEGDYANSLGIHIGNEILINKNNDAGWYTWAHETVHEMRKVHEDLYNRLVKVLKPVEIKAAVDKIGNDINKTRIARGLEPLAKDQLYEEAVAHKLAQEAQKPTFWRRIFQNSFDLFHRLAVKVQEMINASKPHWRQNLKLFENNELVEAEIAAIYQEYLERGGKLPEDMYYKDLSPKTVKASNYSIADKLTKGDLNKNLLIRPKNVRNGYGRTLLVQISSLMTKEEATRQGDKYFDKLYSQRAGYNRPSDFWEIPDWIARMAYQIDNADVLVVRHIGDAIELMNNQNYDQVMFSVMDSNVDRVKRIVDKYDGKVIVGGYVDPQVFKDNKNVNFVSSPDEAAKEMGLDCKLGFDYSSFKGTKTVPRLELSKGCKHKCAFCVVPKKIETAKGSTIRQQINAFDDLKFELVYLNDKTFGQADNYRQLVGINSMIKASNKRFKGFIIQTTAPALLKMDDEWLQKSGIKFVELGMESYNDDILKKIHKPHNTALIDRAVNKLRQNNIAFIPNVIVGLAGVENGKLWTETAETYQNTLDFLHRNSDIISHVNPYILASYEGTDLGKQLGTGEQLDLDENVIHKSWLKDRKLHEKFYDDVLKFGSDQLDKKPVAQEEEYLPDFDKQVEAIFGKEDEKPSEILKLTKAQSGRRGTALGDHIRYGIFEIAKAAGGLDHKKVKVYLEKQKKYAGYDLNDAAIKNAVNTVKKFQNDKKAMLRHMMLVNTREKIAAGKVDERSTDYQALLEEFGSELEGQTIRHTKRFRFSDNQMYGPALSSDKVETVTKKHVLKGNIQVEQRKDNLGYNVVEGPILPLNRKLRLNTIQKIVEKNAEFVDWYTKWHRFMHWFEGKHERLDSNMIEKLIKIQAITSANQSPQGNMLAFTAVTNALMNDGNMMDVGRYLVLDPNMPEALRNKLLNSPVVTENQADKIQAIWDGKDTESVTGKSLNLQERMAAYGQKIGSYMHAGLYPDDPNAVVLDRHAIKPWGYTPLWSGNGKYDQFKIKPVVYDDVVIDMVEVARRMNMVPMQVQAAMWYEAREPDVLASEYQEAAKINPNKFLPSVMIDATMVKGPGMGVHFKKTILEEGDYVLGATKDGRVTYNHYSAGDIGTRIAADTPENPYEPLVYVYRSDALPEGSIKTGRKAHGIDLNKYRIYDMVNDPLDYNKTVNERKQLDPKAHETNILAGMLKDYYDGFTVKAPGGQKGHWVLMFEKALIDEAPRGFNAAVSDVVEGIETDIPQDPKKLMALVGPRGEGLEKKIKAKIADHYRNIEYGSLMPAIANFDVTGGKYELGGIARADGTRSAILSLFSEIGIENSQKTIYVMQEPTDNLPGNGDFYKIKIAPEYDTMEKIEAKIKQHGLGEFNIGVNNNLGYFYIEQFISDNPEITSLEFAEAFMNFVSDVNHEGWPHNTVTEVNSTPIGSLSENPDDALDNYRMHMIEYLGTEKGNEYYEKSIKERESYIKRLREGKGPEADESLEDTAEEAKLRSFYNAPDQVLNEEEYMPAPKKTVTAYKLARMKKSAPGQVFPLFVGANIPFERGKWLPAEIGEQTKAGKVKSRLGPLAFRPGWHSGDIPYAPHIGARPSGANVPVNRKADEVWLEVEVPADVDWQSVADKAADRNKEGEIIPKTAHITDRIPEGGFYRYKTNPNMKGEWIISGAIKINRILTDKEVAAINKKAGVKDLPRKKPLNLKYYGLDKNIEIMEDVAPDFLKDKIGRTDKTIFQKVRQGFDDFWENKTTRTVDRLHPIKEKLGGEGTAYMMHRGLPGIQSTLNAMMAHGKLKWNGDIITTDTRKQGFLQWVKSLGPDAEKAFYWIIAKRAETLENEGREFWLTRPVRDAIFAWVGRPQARESWEQINDEFQEWNNTILELAIDAGLLTREQIEEWQRDFYIPFYRVFEDPEARMEYIKGPAKGKEHLSARVKRLMGAERKIGDPFENIIRNWSHLVGESMANRARQEAAKFAFDNNLDSGLTRVDDNGNEVPVPLIEKVKWADTVIFKPAKGGLTFVHKKTGDEILSYKDKGQSVFIRVNDPELFQSLSMVNKRFLNNHLMRAMSGAKRVLTAGATFGPAFRIANMVRDTLHTFQITEGMTFKPFIDTARGFISAYRNDQDMVEFMASGHAFGGSYVRADDPQALQKYVKRIAAKENLDTKTVARRILDTPKKMLEWWERIGAASENAARVQLYKNLKNSGKTQLEAAFAARDLMDFQMSGNSDVVGYLIATVPFMNARMQGLYKMGRAAVENPKTFLAKGALITAATMLLWWLNKDDERYKELENWDKFSYYHFWIGDKHFRIPKPFETGALWSTLFEAFADVASGNDDGMHIMNALAHTFGETFAFNPIPQIARPLFEQWANKSFFTGRAIENQYQQKLPPGERYDPWTSPTLILAGKLGIPPKRAEALIRGYFADIGMGLLGAADMFTKALVDFPATPTKRIDQYPMIGRFVRQAEPARTTKYMSKFWNTMKDLDELVTSVNSYKRSGDMEGALNVVNKNRNLLAKRKGLNKARERIREISFKIKQVWKHPTMTADEKKDLIDKYYQMRNQYLKQIYDAYIKEN